MTTRSEAKREWDRRSYRRRRVKALLYLGGRCVRCGSTDDLHFDHVDARSKSFNISKNMNRPWEVIQEELDKCQLLCNPCHKDKTREEADHAGGHNKWTEIQHGKVWAYTHYGCKCDECSAAIREYNSERKAAWRLATGRTKTRRGPNKPKE